MIPAYNAQEWRADTLRSAIGQTRTTFHSAVTLKSAWIDRIFGWQLAMRAQVFVPSVR